MDFSDNRHVDTFRFVNNVLLQTQCGVAQLLHHVELVEQLSVGDRKWTVKVKDLQRDASVVESFDAVMVCNGHYFEPRIPKISGQDVFAGEQLHSHDYRVPEIFNGKIVVVLGAGPSGTSDIVNRDLFFS